MSGQTREERERRLVDRMSRLMASVLQQSKVIDQTVRGLDAKLDFLEQVLRPRDQASKTGQFLHTEQDSKTGECLFTDKDSKTGQLLLTDKVSHEGHFTSTPCDGDFELGPKAPGAAAREASQPSTHLHSQQPPGQQRGAKAAQQGPPSHGARAEQEEWGNNSPASSTPANNGPGISRSTGYDQPEFDSAYSSLSSLSQGPTKHSQGPGNNHSQGPTKHSQGPTNHSQGPTKHSQGPGNNHRQGPTNHSQGPTNHSQGPTNHSQSPTNHSQGPTNHSQSPTNHNKGPSSLASGAYPASSNLPSDPPKAPSAQSQETDGKTQAASKHTGRGDGSGQQAGQDGHADGTRGSTSTFNRSTETKTESPKDSGGEKAADKLLDRLRVSKGGMLAEAVQRALHEERPSPRAVTAQTVLCLDCSPSIGDQGLAAMKTAALAFVSGIEEVAEQHGLDENLGVVTFGSSTEVAQHLTIDYQAVREAIESATLGGRSPLLEALLVCLAAFQDRGGPLSIGLVHMLRPRIIIFTDGIATQTESNLGPENFDTTPTHRRMTLMQFLHEVKSHKSTPNPIVWVPVGKPDKELMRCLAKIGDGKFVEPGNIEKECSHYRFHDLVAKVYICARDDKSENWDDDRLRTMLNAIVCGDTSIDKEELLAVVRDKLARSKEEDVDPNDFEKLLEREELPPLGSRVVRGPDWSWEDQDGGCTGTVIGHCSASQWLYVRWDHGGYNRYTFLHHGEGDLTLVDSPRVLKQGETIAVGVRVKRGPDWDAGNEDGGPESIGVVVRVKKSTKVRVRWPNGEFGKYSWGIDGKNYLVLVDREEDQLAQPLDQDAGLAATSGPQAGDPNPKKKVVVWQWSASGKEGEWTAYDEAMKTKLEKQYLARPTSICIIEREGSRRVSFKKMEEWLIDDGSTRNQVRRLGKSPSNQQAAAPCAC